MVLKQYFELSGYQKCQCCENKFPYEFADRCMGWVGGYEQYTPSELTECLGTRWKNYDKKGQWYLWKNNFICPECANKLISNGEAKLFTSSYAYYTSCEYDELQKEVKKFAKPDKTGRGSYVEIPYDILIKVRKKRK